MGGQCNDLLFSVAAFIIVPVFIVYYLLLQFYGLTMGLYFIYKVLVGLDTFTSFTGKNIF